MHSQDPNRIRAAQHKNHAVFFAVFALCAVFWLTSCISGMQGGLFSSQSGDSSQASRSTSSLPKVEVTPPAKFTKGAPAYTMLFHTTASSMSMSGGDSRVVTLRAVSQPGPSDGASPKAYHMIPSGMRMGEYLPLLPPDRQPSASGSVPGTASEPQRLVIKTYWGCGENVRQGQPRVVDTSKMPKDASMRAAMGSAAVGGRGRSGGSYVGGGDLKPGWVEAIWPNREDSRQVPSSASLVGGHFLHGNFLPHMRFNMDAQHDIMERFSLNAERDSLKEAIPITWKKLPTAIGYHLMAVAFSDVRKEMVIWTSSENPDVNVAGQFLDTSVVKRHIASKVILPADRDRCVIPKGIFDGMSMVVVSGTAWGDDYWASEPPRPANASKDWKPDWTVKGQFLSTTNLMLGMPSGGASGHGNPGTPAVSSGSDSPSPAAPGIMHIMRGLF